MTRSKRFPCWFPIGTPDGEGEATKLTQGDLWTVNLPTGALEWYGTAQEAREEVRRWTKREYGVGTVTFGKVKHGLPPCHPNADSTPF